VKKIVIFGSTGNIGAYFTDYCYRNVNNTDFEIIAVGRKDTNFFDKKGIKYCRVNLLNPDDFNKLPYDDVYAVINLTGILPAYISEYDPFKYVDTNINGSLRILEYARKSKADRVLYSQTWSEQGGYWGKREILSPDLPRKMIYKGDHAFYAITKTMIVDTMEYYKQEYGLKNFVFRLPNVYLYHPSMYYYVDCKARPIGYRYMIERASRGEAIELWGNPNAFKDILYIKDLCQMMFKALFVGISGGTYNAGTGERTTLLEQIQGMIDVFSPSNNPSIIISKPDNPGFTSFVMDISNAKQELGYEPEYSYIRYLEDYKVEREQKRFDELWANG